ncbi:MAG TPA: SAM-dependent methyltransferase [Bacteroidales bacterium]|nr:SAM-dependent methyltransferase [Bacteroidales bacterium]
MKGNLYMIPNTLGDSPLNMVIPEGVSEIINELDHFIVENIRTARRFLIKCGYHKPIDDIRFFELNKHTSNEEKPTFLQPCHESVSMGIISEAGVPGVADPGAEITAMAHTQGIRVIPLTGPSSMLLALMASGLNGQNFTFHGYLPVDRSQRIKKLRDIEKVATREGQTQLFIETPYRNDRLLEDILKTCDHQTRLCIACDITLEQEYIKTMPVESWKKERVTLHKRPCIFLIGK